MAQMADTQALATQQKGAVQKGGANPFLALLARNQNRIAAVLPKHLTAERIMNIAVAAYQRTPELQKCTPQSIVNCVVQASILGLEVNTPLGLASLIPYKNECTLQIEYKGLVQLILDTGKVIDIEADCVRDGDEFDYEFGTAAFLKHKPGKDRGALTHAWALARIPVYSRDGKTLLSVATKFVVMDEEEVHRVRNHSASYKAGGSGPWKTDEDQMWTKTAIKRLSKTLPKDVRFGKALEVDNEQESGERQHFDVEVPIDASVDDARNANIQGMSEDKGAVLTNKIAEQRQKRTEPAKTTQAPQKDPEPPPAAQPEAENGTGDAVPEMSPSVYKTAYVALLQKDMVLVATAMTELGYDSIDAIPQSSLARTTVIEDIERRMKEKYGE